MKVYGVWNDADYYGPDLQEPLYATRQAAERARARLNAPYVADCACVGVLRSVEADWPHFIREHDVEG
jgi:hypothetical protein